MVSRRSLRVAAVALLVPLAGPASVLLAQSVEVSPFYGYRFGGDFFELVTRHPVDLDGAPAMGVALDIRLQGGLQLEGFFTHQEGHVAALVGPVGPAAVQRVAVDHWLGGALQEFGGTRIRPFATGMFGLTRYAIDGDNEIRFTLNGGGGAKLFATPHIGVRLDGRISATFIDAHGSTVACFGGGCFLALRANVVWQAEFTAGMVVRFP
jgi:hypothetical protein